MKKILVILKQANLAHLQANESLSAIMVLATFGHQVQVLLQGAGLSLLHSTVQYQMDKMPFKVASQMVESFEFYDLLPILIEQKNQNSVFVQQVLADEQASVALKFVELNTEFLAQFDLVFTW